MTEDYGLPLAEAARRTGVTVVPGGEPQDREVEANGLRLHYLDWGGEALPLLLCIHGYAQNAHSWDFTALALRDRYRVLALDLRGHGDSQWAPDGDYTQPGYLADLEAFIDAVAPGPLVVVGLSLGGSVWPTPTPPPTRTGCARWWSSTPGRRPPARAGGASGAS